MPDRLLIIIDAQANELISEFTKSEKATKQFGEGIEKGKKGAAGFEKGLSGLTKAAGALGLALGAREILAWGKGAFEAAAQAGRLGVATDNLAKGIGESGKAMTAAIQEASSGTVDSVTAMQAANKAMLFGLVENADQMGELTNIAVTLGAAMGQGAAKSVDDLSTALGRQSPMILDNLGITLKLEDAYRIYAASLGKTADQLTEEEKKQAFVNAALEIGKQKVKELGGINEDAATKTERLSAQVADFEVAFGGLLTQMSGGIDTVTTFFGKLEKGAETWQYVFGEALPAIHEATTATGESASEMTAWGQAASIASGSLEANTTTTKAWSSEADIMATRAKEATSALAEEKAALEEEENQTRANEAASARWAGLAEESVQVLDELAQGHTKTAMEAEAYAEAQQAAIEAEEARLDSARALAGTMADYFTGLKDTQDEALQDEADFVASMAETRADSADKQKDLQDKLSEELEDIEKKHQERIHYIETGGMSRSAAETEAYVQESNAHYEQLKQEAIAKSQEKVDAIVAAQEQEAAALAAAHQRELEEQAAHLEELKLQAALASLETTGQLEQFTGGLATSAADAAELINAGVLPVTENMALAIQGALGELATQQEMAMATSQENQALLQEALAGTLEATTATDENTLVGQESVQEALGTTMENINTIAGDSLPEMEDSATSATDAAVAGLDSTTSSANTTASAIKKVAKAGDDISSKLIPNLNTLTSTLRSVKRAAEDAASAVRSVSDAGSSGGFSGHPGRQYGGPVSAGRPYWVGEGGRRELFVPGSNGQILTEQQVTNNNYLTVNSSMPSAGVIQDFGMMGRFQARI